MPSLLHPYLGAVPLGKPTYQNTRQLALLASNLFFTGLSEWGIGSPHSGAGMIWPLSIAVRVLTSIAEASIRVCVQLLRTSHAGTGYMHEAFHTHPGYLPLPLSC